MMEVEKHSPISNHETIEEVDEDLQEETSPPPWKERVQKTAVKLSSTTLGQFTIRQTDRLLWTVEKTAKWSCPEETGTAEFSDITF